jgi:stage V sporulation protein R
MGTHSTRVRRHIDAHGLETVERFLDQALSLENLIDPFLPLRAHMQREGDGSGASMAGGPPYEGGAGGEGGQGARGATFDVLGFLAYDERMSGRLEAWQTDILRIVRAEAYYFQPQRMTKIMNEGWASFWHSRMLTGGVLDSSEIVDFADCHSAATMSTPGRMNPYKLGIELFRHAEATGRDIFRIRRIHNDASFVDELVDEEFVERQLMFVYDRNGRSGRAEVAERDWHAVKQRMLLDLSWGGMPQIELTEVDVAGDGQLVLVHRHDGRDLQLAQAQETLIRLSAVWGGPVQLRTKEEGQDRVIKCEDGQVDVLDTQEPTPGPDEGDGQAQ